MYTKALGLLAAAVVLLSVAACASSLRQGAAPSGAQQADSEMLPYPEVRYSEMFPYPAVRYGDALGMETHREEAYRFVKERLSGPDGVWTNYLDTDQAQDNASGHEVLSESAGLLLRYYALTGQSQAYEAEWQRTKRVFDQSAGFSYRFSPLLQKRYPVNAAVDDLRIIRSLYEAGTIMGEERYEEEARAYGSRLYHYNVRDDLLYDFYDETYRITNPFVTLCYIDLRTLRSVESAAGGGGALYDNMSRILREGYLTDEFPLYETRFDYEERSYQSERINTVEALLSVLALAEESLQQPSSISYIKEHAKGGTLYGQYTRDGKPANDVQSTAIYAIAAMIGAEIGDRELYEDSVNRMNQLRVPDPNSSLYGAFADEATEQVYSFDNLTALLAYAY